MQDIDTSNNCTWMPLYGRVRGVDFERKVCILRFGTEAGYLVPSSRLAGTEK
jgi:hypothetical protein